MKFFKNIFFFLSVICLFSCSDTNHNGTFEEQNVENIRSDAEFEIAFPGEGEWIELPNGIMVRQVGELYVFEGDIVLNEQQKNLLGGIIEFESDSTQTAFRSTIDRGSKWPQGIVYYSINSNLPNRWRVTDAIAHWESVTNIRFVPRTSANNNYLEFISGSGGCYCEYIGYRTGRTVIGLANNCTTGNAIHEIGHAIGLWHEHTRPDRDNFVRINWNNIESGAASQFHTSTQNYAFGDFDFGSVMMYGSFAFNRNGLPTIERLNGTTFLEQRNGLSNGDIAGVHSIYPYLLWPRNSTNNSITSAGGTLQNRFWSRQGASTWLSLQVTSRPSWVTSASASQTTSTEGNTSLSYVVSNNPRFERSGKITLTQATTGYKHEADITQSAANGSFQITASGSFKGLCHIAVYIDGERQDYIIPYVYLDGGMVTLGEIPYQHPYPNPYPPYNPISYDSSNRYNENSEFRIALLFPSTLSTFSTASNITIVSGGVGSLVVEIKGLLKDLPTNSSSYPFIFYTCI